MRPQRSAVQWHPARQALLTMRLTRYHRDGRLGSAKSKCFSSDSEHTITVQYDARKGSISADNVGIPPSGEVEVTDGNSLGFTITPEPDYYIVDLVVDGKSVGASASYTMEDVKDDHTLSARFMKNLALEDGANAEQSSDYGKNLYQRSVCGSSVPQRV